MATIEIYVGPVSTLRALVRTGIRPRIDRIFPFDEADASYAALRQGNHFGKLVIQVAQ